MSRPRALVLATAALLQLSCAAAGLQSVQPTMPAARAGLLPEFRVFYDALADYGDWVLIEPYGYVFRPNVNFVAWQPYQDGFWAPSDIWGWVWISAEPFGWATYHYGRWFYDNFQGWVWTPGLDWGPAWVDWQAADNLVGWAPLGPRGSQIGGYPGSPYTYVPIGALAATNLKSHVLSKDQIAGQLASVAPVRNMAERDGVTWNRGPKLELVERVAGPLPRVRLADITPRGGAKRGPAVGAGGPAPAADETIAAMRHAAEQAAQEARAVVTAGGAPPARVSVLRSIVIPAPAARPAAERRAPGRGKSAAPDSTR